MMIYGEIGPGVRIALSKLATEKFLETGRPLRIAVDVSIWQFQIKSGKGGSNPALRTLYFRLLRLLSLSIQPLFVFDGTHKPPFKRGRRTCTTVSLPNFLTKQLLQLFGFPFIIARGEAEAECALLQREGIVDAVMSEDVDTLMFGCGRSMRNWSSEGVRGSNAPTHVSIYDASKIAAGTPGLDRAGMVLVALMSGGDYIPAGIPGCGIKVACEAARAGFGQSLFRLSKTDTAGLKAWRDSLAHELRSNESNFFRVKHKALQLPETFPNQQVLGYYTHPMVSSAEGIKRLKNELQWNGEIDVAGLRAFVADAFEWRYESGAKHFIRGLAPALLAWKLRTRGAATPADERPSKVEEENIVKSLCGKRTHFSTDGMPEVHVKYVPINIVGLDLGVEEQSDGSIETFDTEVSLPPEFDSVGDARVPAVNKPRPPYDPTELQGVWVGEPYVRVGVPLMFQNWEEKLRSKSVSARTAGRRREKRPAVKGGMKAGALDPFVKVTKPGLGPGQAEKANSITQPPPLEFFDPTSNQSSQLFREPDIHSACREAKNGSERCVARKENIARAASPTASATHTRSRRTSLDELPNEGPRALARVPPKKFSAPLSHGHRYSALGIYGPVKQVGDSRREQGLAQYEFRDYKDPASSRRAPKASKEHRSPLAPVSWLYKTGLEKELAPVCPVTPREHVPSHAGGALKERPSGNMADCPSPSKERSPTRHISGQNTKGYGLPRSPHQGPEQEGKPSESHTTPFRDGVSKTSLTEAKVDRRLDFSSTRLLLARDQMPLASTSLPLTSKSQPNRSPQKARGCPHLVSPPSPPGSAAGKKTSPANVDLELQTATKVMRIVAPRESLAGSWKEVDELEAATRNSVFVGVEVLDMTDGL
ncbi:hypothetical protein FGG08_002822 [Glutinoglossum americanum]|uniref:XPG-I domain-containing protein n=1 Tax=Glutinoglossum americanum TaxID=1670608 RepID=A0A9P8I3U1_9PEZI|nr:hypothetical protein FGG08_002822 [Glutinoglossum americanum]